MLESSQPLELNASQKATFSKAQNAVKSGSHDYAVKLLLPLIKECPSYIEARRLLRASEIARCKGKSPALSALKTAPLYAKAKMALGKSPQEALSIAEDILEIDPLSAQGSEVLAAAAQSLELQETRLLALEAMRDSRPNDVELLRNLANSYLAIGDTTKAQTFFQKVLAIVPTDGEALKGIKDASAAQASVAGKWDQKGDFRDSMKSTEEARKLEQAAKSVASEQSIDEQFQSLYEKLDSNNPNLALVKQMAGLLEKKKDWANALQWYQYALQIANGQDPSIEKIIAKIALSQLDDEIQSKEAQLSSLPPDQQEASKAEIDALNQKRAQQILADAKEMVEKYPTEAALRYELGVALFNVGEYRDAVPELQQALKQPNSRHKSFLYLGQCYGKRNMHDLAKKQYESAIAELIPMDALKKDLTYKLGLTLELMGQKEAALEEFKKIYEVDSKYLDVADRVESSYQ